MKNIPLEALKISRKTINTKHVPIAIITNHKTASSAEMTFYHLKDYLMLKALVKLQQDIRLLMKLSCFTTVLD
ncbi:hypothetical protein SAG0339_04295 [Streptococcus agalactiae GB00679]|nr:hypothetical protein SAG0323_06485 [Streptococcus agalactiae GB00279]EPV33368.1 hypothetical protein SAG0339_04295 [Streptococcus agalactiae GB00679]EPV62138.1 hypothetical protein SAG0360_08660 [Streptococcus agalactiae GB00923]EPV69645.1 hypothetical protein SAG0362_10535 [Streptococcus agalactiae GB00929]EPW72220.1 hypothetical protein SAG0096_09710 [Streptococcus agalactiae BSU447]